MVLREIGAQMMTTETSGIYTVIKSLVASRFYGRDLKLFARQPARSLLLGETRSPFRGRGMEFEEVRRYQPGDDIRTIDWRVSARTGSTHTKLFREERERPVQLLVDQRSTMFFGTQRSFKSVLAAELTAGLAWAALSGSDRIGGLIFGDEEQRDVRARRSRHTVLKLLHDLNELNHLLPGGSEKVISLADMLDECRRVSHPGTAVFLISDFADFDEDAERAMSLLGRHTDLTLLRIRDPMEVNLSIRGVAAFTDGRNQVEIDINSELGARYLSQIARRDETLERAVRRVRGRLIDTSTDQEPAPLLRRQFGS